MELRKGAALSLSKGYKQTELGAIPKDWEIKSIEELCIPSGLVRGPFGGALKKESFVERGYKVYEQKNAIYGNVNLGTYFIDKSKFIELKRFEILKDDFILSCSGTIGKLYQIPESFEQGIINQALLKITINKKIYCDKYFFHFFVWDKFQLKIIDNTQGGAMKNLVGMPIFKATKIPIPPTKSEQTAIANALSDADALISSLEKLIEKKRNIKQGAMQQLLKPKKGWVEMSILQLADNKKELFDDGDWIESEHITTEGIRLIQTGNIGVGNYVEKETKKYINEASFKSIRCKELRIGDLLICRLAEPAGRACILPDIGEYKVVTSVDVTIFRPREDLVNRIFLVNIFSTNKWLEAISGMSGGTTHKRISRGALGRTKIFIPSIVEQNRIAEILNDMDNEIASLEKKLSKSKMLKQGMMQELLTGKIRLV